MNPSDQGNKKPEHNFSAFAVGVSLGVIAALLFTTEEGKKTVKSILDSIPEKYKTPPDIPRTPIITPQETPHHTTYDFHQNESPPPPPPVVQPFRPNNS